MAHLQFGHVRTNTLDVNTVCGVDAASETCVVAAADGLSESAAGGGREHAIDDRGPHLDGEKDRQSAASERNDLQKEV